MDRPRRPRARFALWTADVCTDEIDIGLGSPNLAQQFDFAHAGRIRKKSGVLIGDHSETPRISIRSIFVLGVLLPSNKPHRQTRRGLTNFCNAD